MRKTDYQEIPYNQRITVDLTGLQAMTGMGRSTAERIAREAKACIKVGNRKLYKVDKINSYLDSLSTAGAE